MNRELCNDCVERDDCAICDESSKPILRCEKYKKEFDDSRVGDAAAARGEGLCATCALRESCSRKETEGGVWRCPAYI